MYTAQITFKLFDNAQIDTVTDLLNELLGCYRKNGQILGKEYPIAQIDNKLSAYVRLPGNNSLHKKNNNKYVEQALAKLKDNDIRELKIQIIGQEPDAASQCQCVNRKSLILYTTFLSMESPLRCGDCFSPIPLYEIQRTYDDEFYDILCWETDYQACDQLQMNCSVGERFATNQMSKIDSALNKQGVDVCKSISQQTGRPTYYYLYKGAGKSINCERERVCPSCAGEWSLEEETHGIFDFKCEKCHLLSNIAWNIR